jgi:hypothetical protein
VGWDVHLKLGQANTLRHTQTRREGAAWCFTFQLLSKQEGTVQTYDVSGAIRGLLGMHVGPPKFRDCDRGFTTGKSCSIPVRRTFPL